MSNIRESDLILAIAKAIAGTPSPSSRSVSRAKLVASRLVELLQPLADDVIVQFDFLRRAIEAGDPKSELLQRLRDIEDSMSIISDADILSRPAKP